jgi:antitoxin component YwqK of YwqJK toxin-antitoxin module
MAMPDPGTDSTDEPVEETVVFANGQLKYTGSRLGDAMHGDWTWYRTDGSLMRTGSFVRGRQVGTWRTYDRAGRIVKTTTFPWGEGGSG